MSFTRLLPLSFPLSLILTLSFSPLHSLNIFLFLSLSPSPSLSHSYSLSLSLLLFLSLSRSFSTNSLPLSFDPVPFPRFFTYPVSLSIPLSCSLSHSLCLPLALPALYIFAINLFIFPSLFPSPFKFSIFNAIHKLTVKHNKSHSGFNYAPAMLHSTCLSLSLSLTHSLTLSPCVGAPWTGALPMAAGNDNKFHKACLGGVGCMPCAI